MAYALKYRCEFSSFKGVQYRFDIEQKDYSGGFFTLQATGKPIIQKWQTDDPKPTIKGCNLTFNYLNKGTQPLNIFYSEADNTFKGILTNLTTNEILFVGYLVQDDCNELQVDYTHEVSLSFNDNLGLLKEISFDTAFKAYTSTNLIDGKYFLSSVTFACLKVTNIALPVRIYSNLYETSVTPQWSTFQSTFISIETFLKDDTTYYSCYEVLEKIFKSLECTLFQANGRWHIIRWSELRYYNASGVTCWEWDADFNQLGQTTLGGGLPFSKDSSTYPETGFTKRILRPLKYVKETFNYRNPRQLLKNNKFNILGNLVSTTVSGTNTIYEYEAPYWLDSIYSPKPTRRIQVIRSNTGAEIGRYLILRGATGDSSRSAKSSDIEVAKGDVVSISFKFRTIGSFPAPGNIYFRLGVVNGAAINYAKGDGTWVPTTGAYRYEVTSDLQNWQSATIETGPIPFAGILNLWLGQFDTSNQGTIYSDISFSITYAINESLNVIGHTHTDTQPNDIKNVDDSTIEVDDSPRNSIAGTLFLPQKTGLLYDRTKYWKHELGFQQGMLGRLITFDRLFQRRKPRSILEGTLIGLIFDGVSTLSVLSLMNSPQYAGLYFVWGNIELNYREDSVTGTMYELYTTGEVDGDLIENYNFAYLYENK